MSGDPRIPRPATPRLISMFSVLICFILLYMTCMNHASAKGQPGDPPPVALFGASRIQAARGLQQKTLTLTPSVTASVTLNGAQTVTATPTLTPPGETLTPALTAQGSNSPTPTEAATATSAQEATWTPVPPTAIPVTPEADFTATFTDFPTATFESEQPPEPALTPSSTATLIPYPTLGFRLATLTSTPFLQFLEHSPGASVLPKFRNSSTAFKVGRIGLIFLILGIWIALVIWFAAVHYLDRR